ncbi:hypothetical protein RUND412_005347, partial [Rhizina undulata]
PAVHTSETSLGKFLGSRDCVINEHSTNIEVDADSQPEYLLTAGDMQSQPGLPDPPWVSGIESERPFYVTAIQFRKTVNSQSFITHFHFLQLQRMFLFLSIHP